MNPSKRLSLIALLLSIPVLSSLGGSVALAQDRITAPGVYPASVVYIPGISVPGGLPPCIDAVGRQTYLGEVSIVASPAGYIVRFEGVNEEDSKLRVVAEGSFGPAWGGLLLGPLGGRTDAIVGIDYANMQSGKVNGRVLGANGEPGHFGASLGAMAEFIRCKFSGPGSR